MPAPDFTVFPNPTQSGSFTIKTNAATLLQIAVKDMLGKIVLKPPLKAQKP